MVSNWIYIERHELKQIDDIMAETIEKNCKYSCHPHPPTHIGGTINTSILHDKYLVCNTFKITSRPLQDYFKTTLTTLRILQDYFNPTLRLLQDKFNTNSRLYQDYLNTNSRLLQD